MMRKRGSIIAGYLALSALFFALPVWPRPTADEVMADFHAAVGRCEATLQDPLILHAHIVRNRVIEDIKDPAMDKRRYAIGFLGNVGAREALPALRNILEDETEKDYFRADALESIFHIDGGEGQALAPRYSQVDNLLGWVAREILDGGTRFSKRSYIDALLGRH